MKITILCVALLGWCCCGNVQAQAQRVTAPSKTTPTNPTPPQIMSYGRFENLTLYRPAGTVKQVVLLLSGDGGWDRSVTNMARALEEDGALVIGIDTDALFRNLEKDGGTCVFPDGDLENLSHFVQAYYKLPGYMVPLLVGYSAGASLAYAVLVQAPPRTFAGALSLGFCVDMDLVKPLCKGEDLHFTRRRDGKGVDLQPSKQLPAPWIGMHGAFDDVCETRSAQQFARGIPGSEFIVLPGVGHDYSQRDEWLPQFRAAIAKLSAQQPQPALAGPKNLGDLPIIEVEASGTGNTLAVLLSGDGGWAGLDKDVASALSEKGIPVVGVDSLRYFWTTRTPAGASSDIDRIVRYYLAHWGKRNVILIGYSQGADVLPFIVNRLPAATKRKVVLAALMGLGTEATFEFHLGNWISNGSDGLPIRPEIDKFATLPALCIYGDEEDDSLCPQVHTSTFHVEKLEGGHHFGGDYDQLALLIMKYAHIP